VSAAPPHVAIVCWGFPPYRGVSALRPLALANGLAAADVDVSVVTASREAFLLHYGADLETEKLVDPRISLHRVPFFPETSWPIVNDWPAWRAAASTARIRKWDAANQRFPEADTGSWLPRATQMLHSVHRQKSLDLVIGTGSPYVSLEVAAQFGLATGVPIVLDDRDCAILDLRTREQSDEQVRREDLFQQWLEVCAELWFVNPPIAEMVGNRFADSRDKIRVVENGWDTASIQPAEIADRPREPLRVGHIGPIAGQFPLASVLPAWKQITENDHQLAKLQLVGSLGSGMSPSPRKQLTQSEHVHWRQQFERSQLPSEYSQLDVLLLGKQGGELITGAKPYEYAATGLPIAALVSSTSDTLRVLQDYPRIHAADPTDADAVTAAIRSAIADGRDDDGTQFRAAQDFGAQLSRERLIAPAIDRVIRLASA
jgi:glycosyltransferase involved in cell wall biosynthesis